jgi:hypothetical protein
MAMDARALILLLWLLGGLGAGAAHFALLRRNAALYISAGSFVRAATLQVLRIAGIAEGLTFAAWHGALPLLLAALGVMMARPLILHGALAAP